MSDTTILLNRFQYCHVQDNNTGKIELHEGPTRIQLESHQLLIGTYEKIRVFEGQFALVLNPFSVERNDILEGEREIRIGPSVFSLYPGEKIESGVQNEFVLTDDDALLLRAQKDAPHPLELSQIMLAGTELLLRGPRKYIPNKDIIIKEKRVLVSLAEAQGIYIQNNDTGKVCLVKGPTDFFLESNESLWDKRLTSEELQALGYGKQDNNNQNIRSLAGTPRPRTKESDAVVVDLEGNEVIYLYDGNVVRVEFGPKTVFLESNERPKVLFISGGVPIQPNTLRIAKLGLGPDFIRDRLSVRTKDNATLGLSVTYRWRFTDYRDNPEKLFTLKDFIGFTAQTLSSEIREEAAKHTFEKFHSEACELVKKALFKDSPSRIFSENGLEIFGVDVEGITPEDKEIQNKLADAIKTNVDIYTRRVQEEASLESERRLIDGRSKNEEARKKLIRLEISNERLKVTEHAKTQSEATREKARGEADAIKIKSEAERGAETTLLLEISNILNTPGGRTYIELERARLLKHTDKIIVPTDSKLFLGVSNKSLDTLDKFENE